MEYISVNQLNRKAREFSYEIKVAKNPKVKARLVEDEAAILFVLRNFERQSFTPTVLTRPR